jgi:hypothetical protein
VKHKKNFYIIGICILLLFGLYFVNYSNSRFISIENVSSKNDIIKIISYDNEPIKISIINTSWSDDKKFSAVSGQLLKGDEKLNYIVVFSKIPFLPYYYCEFESIYTSSENNTSNSVFRTGDLIKTFLFKYELDIHTNNIDVSKTIYWGNILYLTFMFTLVFAVRKWRKNGSDE